jgi:hypothetical protein
MEVYYLMEKNRKISWILIAVMLVGLFSGIQLVFPQEVAAEDAGAGSPDSTTPAGTVYSTTSVSLTWLQDIFGSSVNTTDNRITVNVDGSVTVASLGGKGKISSSQDGIAFYNTELAAGTPFQITADVLVNSFAGGNNQVSFGLMLRNNKDIAGVTSGSSTGKSSFVAVGAVNQGIQAFSRASDTATSLNTIAFSAVTPIASNTYSLKLTYTAEGKCYVSCGSNTAAVDATGFFTNSTFFVGLFAARDTSVTFSNIQVVTNVSSLTLQQPTKRDYLLGESFDPTGMSVTANYSDGPSETLSSSDYIITGFNNTTEGTKTVTVAYGGHKASFDITMTKLTCTALSIAYTPAKTTYYIGDQIDTLGMVVRGTFNTGAVRTLDVSEYTISGFDTTTAGKKTVTLAYFEAPHASATFDITVRNSVLQGIEIMRQPAKAAYYIGETLNLSGLVVKAVYDDSSVILQSNEYEVDSTGFDTTTTGTKTVAIKYKGFSINLPLTVQARSLTGIEITTLPKTTFYVGESFNRTGLVVSKVFDSGETEVLAESEYNVDSLAFSSSTPGACNIIIRPNDTTIEAISYTVTVRPQTTYTWGPVIFGQSSSASRNFISATNPGTIDGTITLTALEGGGKVTGAHDGISYYYTVINGAEDNFVLSADVKVLAFAKETPDNQEAFGLMVRDAIGTNLDSSVFSSNIAIVGGYRGVTNGVVRSGVTTSAGNVGTVMDPTNWGLPRPTTANTYPAANYRLTLTKTNTGFTVSLNGNPATTSTFYMPANFNCQDPNLYVGFFVARLATIEVSNVSFSVSAAATDAPAVLPPPVATAPTLDIVSLTATSKTDYTLEFVSNVNGTATIKQDETIIASDVPVTANETFAQNTTITADAETDFTITLTPDTSQLLTSYDRLVSNFTVAMKIFETSDGAIYVSPTGASTATGEKADPVDLDTALQFVKEGQTIYMLGGTYNRTTAVTIPMQNDGSASGLKTLSAYNGEAVLIDFGTIASGIQIGGSYWHITGINVTRSNNNGILVGGNNNIIERCTVYANANTGLQISRFLPTLANADWPANNLILNCDAYDNRDASENNADGFAAKLTCGEGNVFRGCIAHNNIDDGWDLYTKAETGPIGAVLIEDCIAYNNGTLTNGRVGAGDKNGFKLGGEGIAVANIIRNSIAFGNGAAGFTSNSNPAVQAYNCTSYNNTGANFVFTTSSTITPQFTANNVISYRSASGVADSYPAALRNGVNYFWNGTASVNSLGMVLPSSYFASLTPSLPYQRDAQGNIIWGNFLRHITSSNDGGETSSGSTTAAPLPPSTSPAPTVTLPAPALDGKGNATITVPAATIQQALTKATAGEDGIKTVGLIIPQVPGATAYNSVLPVSTFNAASLAQRVEVRTALGTVSIPGNMLNNAGLGTADVSLSIASVNKDSLSADIKAQIGNRPVIELSVSSEGKSIRYDNPDAPVNISIPYTPSADELKDPEHIVVWYIDGSGNAIAVPNGRYDAATGTVVFSTTHFSTYAITSAHVTFNDLSGFSWAKKSIEVLASKGVIGGTSDKAFTPAAKITRAEYTEWLVRALGLSAKADSGFSDVEPKDSHYGAVVTAKKLGIVKGTGNNRFNPGAPISRQEMFVMAARALRLTGKLITGDMSGSLSSFRDNASVSPYAVNDIAALIKSRLIKGNTGDINPHNHATRAEAASFLYEVYNRNR